MPLDAIIRAHCSRKKGQGWAKNAGLTSEARLAIAIATAFLPVMMLSGRTCAAAALRAVLRRLPPLPRVASHRVAMGTLLSFSALFLRSEEHTSELQSLMRISYAVFCLKKNKQNTR